MKTIKIALLGTAALAAVSVSAQASTASDVAALRAQVEALSAQVAAAQTTPDLPAGYQFMTTSMQPSLLDPTRKAFTISIMPTADAPASTVLQWSGFARAALVYNNSHTDWINDANIASYYNPRTSGAKDSSSLHIKARGELTVTGKTDTAVGEVGATLTLRSNFDGNNAQPVNMQTAKGYWAMTPNLTLSAGSYGFTGGIGGYGTDKLNAFFTDGAPNSAGTPGDTTQFALAYADGPISFTVAAGHYEYNDFTSVTEDSTSPYKVAVSDFAFGAAAEYKGDAYSAKVAGWVHGADYQFGVGATASMDMFTLSAAAAIGKDALHDFSFMTNSGPVHDVYDATYWNANVFAGASLSDSVKAEVGAGYAAFTDSVNERRDSNKWGVAGGIYYSPVSQLTIGAEASWNKTSVNDNEEGDHSVTTDIAADLVTVFKF